MRRYLLVLTMSLCLAGSAEAASIIDTIVFEYASTDLYYGTDPDGRIWKTRDEDPGVVAWLNTSRDDYAYGFYDYITYQHICHLRDATITSATITLTLRENDTPDEWATVSYTLFYNYLVPVDWDIGEVTHGTHDYGNTIPVNWFSSYDDGVWLGVTLRSVRGDFAIDKSVLTVNYDLNPVPVPSTLLLLGCGLSGFVGLRKKFKK